MLQKMRPHQTQAIAATLKHFKRKDRGTELGIPVAVLDEVDHEPLRWRETGT